MKLTPFCQKLKELYTWAKTMNPIQCICECVYAKALANMSTNIRPTVGQLLADCKPIILLVDHWLMHWSTLNS